MRWAEGVRGLLWPGHCRDIKKRLVRVGLCLREGERLFEGYESVQ